METSIDKNREVESEAMPVSKAQPPVELKEEEQPKPEEEGEEHSVLSATPYVVDTTPYALWSFHMQEENLLFIEGVDPGYYEHLLNIYIAALESDEKQYAGVSLRTLYAQALETMFALLGAAVQAPNCVVGWMLTYQNQELFSLIRKIHNGESVFSRLKTKHVTWKTLAEITLGLPLNEDQNIRRVEAIAIFWRRLAEDFLDAEGTYEYNSIKHGLRSRMSGFHFAIGIETEPGVPARQMTQLSNSEFGTQFYTLERIVDRRNLKLVWKGRNWRPEKYAHAVRLIAMSIRNILTFLKHINGVPSSKLGITLPEDLDVLHRPWSEPGHWFNMGWSSNIEPGDIITLSKEDILATYQYQQQSADRDDEAVSAEQQE